ncbi:MAG: murein transglycosylase domain-containing protein [Pseudomonadota bacterium]
MNPSKLPRGICVRCLLLGLTLVLAGCETAPERILDVALSDDPKAAARAVVTQEISDELQRQGIPINPEDLSELLLTVQQVLRDIWSEPEPEVASERRYVKYSNAYQARATVDFEAGWLQVETIAEASPLPLLKQAIVETLLTTRNMQIEEVFTDAPPDTDGEPFLFGQILDQDSQPIRWRWRAERYADYLIDGVLQRERRATKTIHYVRVDLVDDHLHLRELEYASQVLAAAQRYDIEPALIYAVIEVESAFNPYAVSPALAFGLMQVVPATAGRDVYARVKNQSGQPTRSQLFQPDFNIDIGSAYLHLLDDVYLSQIRNQNSRHFAMIASYNGGPGSTLRAFAEDRERALQRINGMQSKQVFNQLRLRHPFSETRRYLEKVTDAERSYR